MKVFSFRWTIYWGLITTQHYPTLWCRRAAVSFNSMESKKGKRKRRKLQGEGQSVRYCAIDQTHPIPTQAWGLIQPPSLQRRPRTEGREVEVTPLKERRERERERENIQNTYIAFLTFFSQHEIMCSIHVITCSRCADVIESQGDLHKETGWYDFDSVGRDTLLQGLFFYFIFI